ncbi:FHA domain-containing protein [Microlunatus flavus]|uniref:FHA domain-containing protein n=1 Tax=Microlunatus flavus TaxID=1036181 RepID=A0A1H9I795_9ACTN|nr:FHA domain-containing protein [Microlunatus flavus]SEQ70275.1 FHA domain-containing protein [Microlunatus flavus]
MSPDLHRCPNGHFTSAADYCDVCGAPVDAGAPATGGSAPEAAVPAAAALEPCPSCGTPHGPDALFCEGCGYDFTTGAMPRPLDPPEGVAVTADVPPEDPDASGLPDVAAPAPVPRWVVEVWVDPDWYAESQGPDPLPTSGPPRTVVLTGRSALVGRPSASRNIHPDVDCADDTGVSRRHAQVTTDGTRFFVEDLESANGTFVAPSGGPLPQQPVGVGAKHELGADDRVYVGAWTRLVVRPATEDEGTDQAG